MKLIFLDVDGVLNDHTFDPEIMCGQIHSDKVNELNRILRATGALIVLSSAWRYIVHRGEANLMGMEWLLRSHGVIAGRLAGVTRMDECVNKAYEVFERGQQVTEFLHEWPGVERYVVIDDLDLGITEAGHPFVQTDGAVGLTAESADEAIAILCGGTE